MVDAPTCRILIIEDHEPTALLLADIFNDSRDLKYDVHTAVTLQAGLRTLAEMKADILLLDLLLPDAKDFEALIRIHRDHPDLPIVVLTVFEDEALMNQAVQYGACDYILKKNMEPLHLQRAVRYALDRTAHRRELTASERYYRSLFESTLDFIAVIDPDGTLLYESPSVKTFLGLDPSARIGHSAFDHIHPEDRPAVHNALELCLQEPGRPQVVEYRLMLPDGTWRILGSTGHFVCNPERGNYVVVNSRDITERKRNEEQIRDLLWRVSDDYEKLQKLDQMKDVFLATVSHELRTPLTSILGYVKLVLGGSAGPMNETQTGFLKTVHSNAERLHALVNDLLDLTSLKSGVTKMDYSIQAVGAALDSAVRTMRPAFTQRNIRLEQINRCGQDAVGIDEAKMERVLTNLLSNAMKFGAAGTVEVGAEWQESGSQRDLHLWVKDEGVGIPAGELEKIFDRFYQVDSALTRKVGGTGLGLSICKKFVEAHHGRIWAESTPDRGTTFHVVIPPKPPGPTPGS